MGDIISAIHDDYSEYKQLCEKLKVQPLPIRDSVNSFYDHREELLGIKKINKNKSDIMTSFVVEEDYFKYKQLCEYYNEVPLKKDSFYWHYAELRQFRQNEIWQYDEQL